jgi:hypothetical protein
MAKISKKVIDNLREFMDRDCEYAGTQDVVNDITTEILSDLGSRYPYSDEIGLIDADGEFNTIDNFANMFWDRAVIAFLNVLATEDVDLST